MGGWLARLKNEKAPDTHATKPTKPPQGDEKAGFVGFVAYPPPLFKKSGRVMRWRRGPKRQRPTTAQRLTQRQQATLTAGAGRIPKQ